MTKDEATARRAREVSVVLGEILELSPECPRGADPFDWSSDVLDELARAVATIGRVVDRFAGDPSAEDSSDRPSGPGHADSVDAWARGLATAIVRQRNSLIVPGSAHRHHPAPVLPAPPIRPGVHHV